MVNYTDSAIANDIISSINNNSVTFIQSFGSGIKELICGWFFQFLLLQNSCACHARYDHLVAIERSGRAADGNYYNMRGVNVKNLVDPIDDLFVAAANIPGISTTGSSSRSVHDTFVLHWIRSLVALEATGSWCFDLTLLKFLCFFSVAGIGDGGNELGMGKVKEIVNAKMPKGELIACDVPADFAITAGKIGP